MSVSQDSEKPICFTKQAYKDATILARRRKECLLAGQKYQLTIIVFVCQASEDLTFVCTLLAALKDVDVHMFPSTPLQQCLLVSCPTCLAHQSTYHRQAPVLNKPKDPLLDLTLASCLLWGPLYDICFVQSNTLYICSQRKRLEKECKQNAGCNLSTMWKCNCKVPPIARVGSVQL